MVLQLGLEALKAVLQRLHGIETTAGFRKIVVCLDLEHVCLVLEHVERCEPAAADVALKT